MDIAFDPATDAINREKHGVSLAFGERVFADPGSIVLPTIRFEDGERRDKAIGLVGDRLWTAVFVLRGATVRLISVRKSNGTEVRGYHRNSSGPR